MSDNLKLWNDVCETDPAYTKKVNMRGGFTDIDNMYSIRRATELWGPYGTAWGIRDTHWTFVRAGEHGADIISLMLEAEFYYPNGAFPIAVDMPYNPKDEVCKKLQTMAIGKSLSRLGFHADVYLGRFDDSAYVAELEKKYGGNTDNRPDTVPAGKSPKKVTKRPDPEPEESGVLGKLANEYAKIAPEGTVVDFKKLQIEVWDQWHKYPASDKSIPAILKVIPVGKVVTKNDFLEGVD